jgi:hypothetical protein
LQEAYLWARTTDEGTEIGARERTGSNAATEIPGKKKGEFGRRNSFPEHYTGKEYGGENFELLTMGMESLFAGSEYLDDDHRQWLLGVLATADLPASGDGGRAPAPAKDPLAGIDLDTLSDAELAGLLGLHGDDDAVADRILAEMDARDAGPPPIVNTPEEDRVDALIAKGYSYLDAYASVHDLDPAELARQEAGAALDVGRMSGESRDQAVKRMYAEWVQTEYLAAEEATNGQILTREAWAAGVDPLSLFSGPAHIARSRAAEELLRWWGETGRRKTLTEFRADMLRREQDQQAAARTRLGANGQEFGV